MKMTPSWLEQTVEQLGDWGFDVAIEVEDRELEGIVVFTRTRYRLARSARERLVLDLLAYPDGTATYWLEVEDWFGFEVLPYRLDSWRHREGQIEFKFQIDPDAGTGLSFFLRQEGLVSRPSPS